MMGGSFRSDGFSSPAAWSGTRRVVPRSGFAGSSKVSVTRQGLDLANDGREKRGSQEGKKCSLKAGE